MRAHLVHVLNQTLEPTPYLAFFGEHGVETRVDVWPKVVGYLLIVLDDVEQSHQVITQFKHARGHLAHITVGP